MQGHTSPITALDFSEPYGTLVTASQEDSQPRVWDLLSGEELGRLRGHRGTVKCIQVEDHVCLTGGEDGNIRLWDLRRVDEEDDWEREMSLSDVAEEEGGVDEMGNKVATGQTNGNAVNGIRSSSVPESTSEKEGPCVRVLEGHSKAVTTLYFEDDCLVSPKAKLLLLSLIVCFELLGHWCLRQNHASMGPCHRPMCHDNGHPMGYITSPHCWSW